MKINNNTLSVLKNFSTINPSIGIKKGNVLKTISAQKSVMAMATLDQDMEGDAAIYDLSRFLSTLSLFEEPDLEFGEKKFTIKGGRTRVNYTYASESMILTPPDRDISLPSVEATVDVSWADFEKVMKAAAVLKLPDITFIGSPEGIKIAAMDVSNPSADIFDVQLSDAPSENFTAVFRSENLKLLPGDYNVTISSKGISCFKNEKVTYFVAIETTSKF